MTSDKRELRRWDQLDLGPLPMAASALGGYPWQQLERVREHGTSGDAGNSSDSGYGSVFVTALPPPSRGLTLCFSGKCGDGLPSPSGTGSGSGRDFVLRATGVSAGWIGAVTREGDAVGEGEHRLGRCGEQRGSVQGTAPEGAVQDRIPAVRGGCSGGAAAVRVSSHASQRLLSVRGGAGPASGAGGLEETRGQGGVGGCDGEGGCSSGG